MLASGGGEDETVRLWSVASGECSAVLEGHEGELLGVYMCVCVCLHQREPVCVCVCVCMCEHACVCG